MYKDLHVHEYVSLQICAVILFSVCCYVFVSKFSAIFIHDSVITSYFITSFAILFFTRSNHDGTRQM